MKNKKNQQEVYEAKEKAAIKTKTKVSVSEEDIKRRAYELYLQRGGLYGPAEVDWLQAEAELKSAMFKKEGDNHL